MQMITSVDTKNRASFKTSRLNDSDLNRLAKVLIILSQHFLSGQNWTCHLTATEGSLTLRKDDVIVKLFLDPDFKLRDRILLADSVKTSDCVLGVELTHTDPVTREAIRDYLLRHFGSAYADPRLLGGSSLIYVTPDEDHIYDVAWLLNGDCGFEVSESEVDKAVKMLKPDNDFNLGSLLD